MGQDKIAGSFQQIMQGTLFFAGVVADVKSGESLLLYIRCGRFMEYVRNT